MKIRVLGDINGNVQQMLRMTNHALELELVCNGIWFKFNVRVES